MSNSLAEWAALVVDEIDENEFLRGTLQGDAKERSLPVTIVKLPVDDMSKIAVLSWRWDGEYQLHGSRNVCGAIRIAKQRDIRYLFVDAVSIDQKLSGAELIRQVTEFSTLYKTIQVIATYDKPEEDFDRTIRRPWILSELHLMRYNPTRIIYVGHSNQGAFHNSSASPFHKKKLGAELWRFQFGRLVEDVWRGGFTFTILGVLCNTIGMSQISDFKFILPPYAKVLNAAYEKMSANDYLLTAAILAQIHGKEGETKSVINEVQFNQYKIDYDGSGDIILNGTKVGTWDSEYDRYWNEYHYRLMALPSAERVIFTVLGLTDSDYEEFTAQEEARRACLQVESIIEGKTPLPEVEIVSVTL